MTTYSTAHPLPDRISEWLPSLTLEPNWIEQVPACLRESAQAIANATGEAFEVSLAPVLVILSSLLRRTRTILGLNHYAISPELNALIVRPDNTYRLHWYNAACKVLLEQDSVEHFALQYFTEEGYHQAGNASYRARESMVLSEPRISLCLKKWDLGRLPVILLNSTSTALTDEFANLTCFEKRELARTLQLAWDHERIGNGRTAFNAGLALLWGVAASEVKELYDMFYDRAKPAPILLLEAEHGDAEVPKEALRLLPPLLETALSYESDIQPPIQIGSSEQALINAWMSKLQAELTAVPHSLVRKQLEWIPDLYFRILALFYTLSEQEGEDVVKSAFSMTAALAQQHYSALKKHTADFTAARSAIPENPDEVIAEYQLIAKIEKHAPMTRSELNKYYSNHQRELLDARLSRLIRDGRIAVDERKRFYVRSLMSVYE